MGLSVKIPGSCGELVQGMIDDIPFLVTCPISMYTKASITKYFSYLPYKASSSADIASICQLTALSCKRILSQDEISKIATSIEPTDGIFCKGIVRYNHLNGQVLEHLGLAPKIKILMFE